MVKPYYEDDSVALFHGDFREILPSLNLQPDLVIADPPYGETSLDWDTWPDGWPSIVAEHARSMWCFGSMRMFLERRDDFADWSLSQDVVWEKHAGTGFASDRFKRVHEHALHWYRGPWGSVHHEALKEPSGGPNKGRTIKRGPTPHYGKQGGKQGKVGWIDEGTRLVRSVIKARNMHGRAINETEKPPAIVQPLVEYGCPQGGLLIDVFSGSGVTGVVAKVTGRRAVLFEKRESQCESAAKRLSQDVLDFGSAS